MSRKRYGNNKKQPVTVGGIEFDALIDSTESYSATSPSYPVEDGYSVNDTVVLDTLSLDMTLYVTNTPVTWIDRHDSGRTRVNDVCNKMIALYKSRGLVNIVTRDKRYSNMIITSMQISKTVEQGYAREIPISFKEVIITKTETGTVPDSYVRAGTSMQTTGAASTTSVAGSSGSSSGAGTGGSGGSGGSKSSDSNSSSTTNASLLYKMGTGLGFIKPSSSNTASK